MFVSVVGFLGCCVGCVYIVGVGDFELVDDFYLVMEWFVFGN